MESKKEKLKGSKVKLTVTVPAADMAKYYKHAFDHLAPSVKIQGFRPGKAPRAMIESGVGISRIVSHALDEAVQDSYVEALTKDKLAPIAPPSIAITKYPEYGLDAEEVKNDLEYTAEVDLFPEVELEDYSKVKIEDKGIEKVKEEDVKKILEHLQKQKAEFTEIDRAAKKGDFAEIDFAGFDKGVQQEAMTSKNHPIVLGEGSLIPGFEDEIAGMKKGEEKSFKITFPKDYHAKEHAGKEVEFKVKLNALKEVKLPELDDAFAKNFDRKDMADLRAGIEESLGHELEHKHEHEIEEKVVEKMLPLLKVEVPESMVEQEVDRTIEGFRKQLENQRIDFDTYMKSTKKDMAAMRKDARPQAEKNIKVGLLLGKIIKDQKLDEKDPQAGRKALDFLVKALTEKRKNEK